MESTQPNQHGSIEGWRQENDHRNASLWTGNPSDGYFGKTISISVKNFGAHVSPYETPELCIAPQRQDGNTFRNIHELIESVDAVGYSGRFPRILHRARHQAGGPGFTVHYESSIPRQIGPAGSSAIATAAMKAPMQFYEVDIPCAILPGVVLSVETEKLGIKAGLQDRVIQVYGGCVYMDFSRELMRKQQHGNYERLDPALLPPLYIAYRTDLGRFPGNSSTIFATDMMPAKRWCMKR